MALFDAVYGDAYAAMEKMLEACPMTPAQLRFLLNRYLTLDGAMEVEAKLTAGDWPLLTQNDEGLYESVLPRLSPRPLTTLELRWLRGLCEDVRAPLFLTDDQLMALRQALENIPPLFAPGEIESFDASQAGDSFEDPAYRKRFQTILRALREGRVLKIRYVTATAKRADFWLIPERLEYSAKDLCFRLHGSWRGYHRILKLSRMRSVELNEAADPLPEAVSDLCAEPITVQVRNERNTLARFMLEFSCFKKESTIDHATGTAEAKIWYPVKDEMEVLIRLLGFGPTIWVTGPERFVQKMRERVERQDLI